MVSIGGKGGPTGGLLSPGLLGYNSEKKILVATTGGVWLVKEENDGTASRRAENDKMDVWCEAVGQANCVTLRLMLRSEDIFNVLQGYRSRWCSRDL